LLLTGLRLNEAAHMSWSEIHGKTAIIPASRMKGREGKAIEHQVPISSALQEVMASLPRYWGGPYLFSYFRRGRRSPVFAAWLAALARGPVCERWRSFSNFYISHRQICILWGCRDRGRSQFIGG